MKSRRALIRGQNDVVMETIDLGKDRPGRGEVLLKTLKTFISAGTELANYTGLDPTVFKPGNWNSYPWGPGYANISRVEGVGPGVPEVPGPAGPIKLAEGERVFTFGRHCSHHFFPVVPAEKPPATGSVSPLIAKVPDGLDDATAAASRMAEVSITAIQVADFALNDWVVVFGLGSVGNLAAQFFKLMGGRVIGIDPFEPRRRLATRAGIEHVIGGSSDEVAERIKELTSGAGARITVDAVGDSRVVRDCARSTARFGDVVILGTPRAPVEGNLTDLTGAVHWKWINMKGALEWRIPLMPATGARHSTLGNVYTILDLVQRGRLKVDDLISHVMDPEDIKSAYEGLQRQKDKYWGVVLDWDGTGRGGRATKTKRTAATPTRAKGGNGRA